MSSLAQQGQALTQAAKLLAQGRGRGTRPITFANVDLTGTNLEDVCPANLICDPFIQFRTIEGKCKQIT